MSIKGFKLLNGNTDLYDYDYLANKPNSVVEDVQVNGTSVVSQGVAEIPVASADNLGVVGINTDGGVVIDSTSHKLLVKKATDAMAKAGTNNFYPVVSSNQHNAAFYGLAKAAGDTTQSSSNNAVGSYTTEAKAAIKEMLGVTDGGNTETVSGSTPTITAQPNTRYICGEVTSLDFTPSAAGTCDVIFTSGSTVTVLTLPQTVMMPEWFEVEANTTYEISITDGVYGVVMSWAI